MCRTSSCRRSYRWTSLSEEETQPCPPKTMSNCGNNTFGPLRGRAPRSYCKATNAATSPLSRFSRPRVSDRRTDEPLPAHGVAWRQGALAGSEGGDLLAEFEHLAQHDFADLPRDGLWMACMTYLVDVCTFVTWIEAKKAHILPPFSAE